MTQQNIRIYKADKKIHDSFINFFSKNIFKNQDFQIIKSLDQLHLDIKYSQNILTRGNDQNTIFHKMIYKSFDEKNFFNTNFWISYKKLCLNILSDLKLITGYKGKWALQRYPTIRFHFPNNISVFEFHRDSDYSHPIGEINCFYAVNECHDSSALQVEKVLGFENYEPLNLKSGEYALLNTSIYKHGDIKNETLKTRVSMDFRFIPLYLLKNNEKKSLTTGKKFSIGSYFMSEDNLCN